jgi:outer membrane protein assembly factor BamD
MKPMIRAVFCSLLTVSLLVACAKNKDPYLAYRQKSAKVIYTEAQKAFNKGDYVDAVRGYDALNTIYPFSSYSKQARLNLITAYYKDSDVDNALTVTEEYVRLYPRDKQVDYAYYIKGLMTYRQGLNWLQRKFGQSPAERDVEHLNIAYNTFQIIVQNFPQSRYWKTSKHYMSRIEEMIAQHYLIIGQFYYKHKAYVAAVNRANFVLKHFPNTVSASKALALNVKAYRKLKMTQLEQDSLRRLKQYYPNSPASRKLR